MDSFSSWIATRRRRGGLLIGGLALSGLMFMLVSASATVAPSGFEGNDGNMALGNSLVPADLGTKDWATLSSSAVDRLDDSTTSSDDSLGKGSKEDDLVANVVTQSVPPKDDFKHVFLSGEHVGGKDFLYLSSIRAAPNGSANLNVELNKGTDGNNENGPPATPKRVAGDRLITFDFKSGGSPTITILKWATATSNPGATCADSNSSLPCWIEQTSLPPAEAEGAANDGLNGRAGALTAAQNALTGEALAANTFQEMSVNLTDTGVLPAGVCETFAVTQVKSRASGATGTFNSALKDLVIANHPISNCGSVKIHKEDDDGSPLAGVHFDLYTDVAPEGGSRGAGDTKTTLGCTTDADGDCTIADVPLGRYWVVEDPATKPANHDLAPDQNINITTGGQEVSLTFVNPRQPGSIDIHKVDDLPSSAGGPNDLAGATFTVYKDKAPLGGSAPGPEDTTVVDTCTTVAGGDCPTMSNIPLGQYWVVETGPVPGYATAPPQHVVLDTGGETVGLTFVDPRKHRVIVLVCHQGTNTLDVAPVTVGSTTDRRSGRFPARSWPRA